MTPKGYLIGVLTVDPKAGNAGQNSYARFSVVCNDNFAKVNTAPKSHFFNCVAWGKTAQFVQNFLKKGDKIFAEYSITTGSYTNAEGREIRTFDLVISTIESLNSRGINKDEIKVEEEDNISIDDIYSKD
ncbi:single-stranded DNA-binding protein [Candidatus Mycoplasma haematobovis]|uniref:Single-stranded DNA-binding protein n=1 Tax=Candidatus Mycoplasma haematobovis TaxID=432608 RepID=A0A1A9QF20_9MOLU|nr:single-stranded DNA-binding protein [Candidatus Mycoplasma haematobovis]OAL10290.1 single-stranded DNA-binding protein [Candidatus Mycoplasma haematobovis]